MLCDRKEKQKSPARTNGGLQTQMLVLLVPYYHQSQTTEANSFCAAIALHLAKHAVQKKTSLPLRPKSKNDTEMLVSN